MNYIKQLQTDCDDLQAQIERIAEAIERTRLILNEVNV